MPRHTFRHCLLMDVAATVAAYDIRYYFISIYYYVIGCFDTFLSCHRGWRR